MAEKVTKTYRSTLPALSLSHPGEKNTIRFIAGLLTTDDKEVQEHIESSDFFGKQITLAPTKLESLAAEAARLRTVAVQAEAAAKKAEAALAAEQKPKPVPQKVA